MNRMAVWGSGVRVRSILDRDHPSMLRRNRIARPQFAHGRVRLARRQPRLRRRRIILAQPAVAAPRVKGLVDVVRIAAGAHWTNYVATRSSSPR